MDKGENTKITENLYALPAQRQIKITFSNAQFVLSSPGSALTRIQSKVLKPASALSFFHKTAWDTMTDRLFTKKTYLEKVYTHMTGMQ